VVSAASPFAPVAPVTTPSAAQVATPLCAAPSRPSEIRPLAPERFKVQFTASASLHDKLRRAQDLLRHRIPSGDLSQVFELALNTLIERLDREKFAATDRPRVGRGITPGSRAIPAEVKRAVWKRDDGRCAFVGKDRRCNETGFLEFHHVVPFGRDGEATVENIALRCWAHNQYEAVLDFGPRDLGRSIEMEGPPRAP
jgi:5-methylcytosine-specific restriction endonuclease McrA